MYMGGGRRIHITNHSFHYLKYSFHLTLLNEIYPRDFLLDLIGYQASQADRRPFFLQRLHYVANFQPIIMYIHIELLWEGLGDEKPCSTNLMYLQVLHCSHFLVPPFCIFHWSENSHDGSGWSVKFGGRCFTSSTRSCMKLIKVTALWDRCAGFLFIS